MKRILLSLLALCLGVASQAQSLPHLAKVGQSLSLIVEGSPMVLRAGELNNSTASSIRYMEEQRTFERLKALNLNSVIATASWEFVEYRRLNGDERNVFLADGKITALRVKMYHY